MERATTLNAMKSKKKGAYAKQQHHKAVAMWDHSCRNMALPSL